MEDAAVSHQRQRSASPEFERMNANGLLGLHGDDLRIAAEMESIGNWMDPQSHDPEDHELHPPEHPCARCGQAFDPADAVRRRHDGGWVHQSCPPPSGHGSQQR